MAKKNEPGDQIIKADNEVEVKSPITLSSYKNFITPDEHDKLLALVEKLKGKRIMFINATPHGGGVAIMRHDLLPLLQHLGVDAHWYVLIPDTQIFLITKHKFHNILQGVAPADAILSDDEKHIYEQWSAQNAQFFKEAFAQSDIIVVDDMQPSGLIPHIKDDNKNAKIVYRSHIQIDTALMQHPDSPQSKTWEYLWHNISLADLFVSHPVASFVPADVPKEKVVFLPPFIDPLSDLNREMTPKEIDEKMELFDAILKRNNQTPLDLRRPYVIQVARFDPSKGIPDVLETYRRLAETMHGAKNERPQLVIVGNSSVDDPDGSVVLNQALGILAGEKFADIRADVKLAILPPDDLLLNALMRTSKIALQLSTKEGFEFKVTEALMKGKPVIATNVGGMPLQIKDGVNGFLVPSGDAGKAAEFLSLLLSDADKYKAMSEAAAEYYDHSYLIVPNAIHWMEIWTKLLGA